MQHEAQAVVETANTIHKTLRHSLTILLTWLYTTEELEPKGATAEAIVEAIVKLLPERVLAEKWFSRFSKTLKKTPTDLSVLEGQLAKPVETEPAEIEEPSEPADGEDSTEDLSSLPKSNLISFFN